MVLHVVYLPLKIVKAQRALPLLLLVYFEKQANGKFCLHHWN